MSPIPVITVSRNSTPAAATSANGAVGARETGNSYYPEGVAVDGQGNVYVADSFNDRIQKFDSSGNYLGQWGSCGSGNGQFKGPLGVAVDGQGNVYVADTGNNRIQKFDSSGGYLGQWGSYGSENGQFKYPIGVAVDGKGNIYVADLGNGRHPKIRLQRHISRQLRPRKRARNWLPRRGRGSKGEHLRYGSEF